MTLSRIADSFASLRRRSESALIPYLPVGYPEAGSAVPLARASAEAGADLIELGVPFSDPLADGPTLQRASQVALANGTTVGRCLEAVAGARRAVGDRPLLLMGYLNPFLAYGLDRLVRDFADAGGDAVIVPDLPPEAAGDWLVKLRAARLGLIFLVAPTTAPDRLRLIASEGSGFLYCVSTTGITGTRVSLADELPDFVRRVRSATDLPLAVGFGISTADHVRSVSAIADGAIVGSALVEQLSRNLTAPAEAARTFLTALKAAASRG
jgi:tryptophan synthase alpha chain